LIKILIEIPTWLGDAVMATPAIQNLVSTYSDCDITIFGSFVSTKLFLNHPNVDNVIIDNSKSAGNRYLNLYRLAKDTRSFDIAFSFRRNFTTKLLLFFLDSQEKHIYRRYTKKQVHQVVRYNDFVNKSLGLSTTPSDLKIYLENDIQKTTKPLLGINPGATYGSAKRWYPQEFAKVAIELSSRYDIVIFGGPGEVDIAKDIEDVIRDAGILNYQNLAGKTTIPQLLENIASLDLFITGDSGPMHVAAAFKVPTIAIFGPTKDIETSQWNNPNGQIVKKEFDCAPCMKRVCPLDGEQNHQCMKEIKAQDILDKISL